jgi:hypothetical protein
MSSLSSIRVLRVLQYTALALFIASSLSLIWEISLSLRYLVVGVSDGCFVVMLVEPGFFGNVEFNAHASDGLNSVSWLGVISWSGIGIPFWLFGIITIVLARRARWCSIRSDAPGPAPK